MQTRFYTIASTPENKAQVYGRNEGKLFNYEVQKLTGCTEQVQRRTAFLLWFLIEEHDFINYILLLMNKDLHYMLRWIISYGIAM